MGILERAYAATNREADEKLLIAGIADFSLRRSIHEHLDALNGADFYNPIYGKIWDAAKLLAAQDRILVLSPFREHLTEQEYAVLERHVGVGARMVEVERGVEYVREAAMRRRAIDGMKHAAELAMTAEHADQALMTLRQVVDDADTAAVPEGAHMLSDLVDQYWAEVENPPENRAVPTPWAHVNDVLAYGGLHAGSLTTVAARSGGGKTVAFLNCAEYAALNGYKVAFFSIEMVGRELRNRMLASASGQRLRQIANYQLADDATDPNYWDSADRGKVRSASDKLRDTTLRIWDDPGFTMDFVYQQCQLMKRTVGLDLVVVDYIQRVRPTVNRQRRDLEIADTTSAMKILAQKLQVAVLTGSQLNRDEEVSLNSLRESSSIEHDSDTIWAISHEYQDGLIMSSHFNFLKQRAGRTPEVPMLFEPHKGRFVDG